MNGPREGTSMHSIKALSMPSKSYTSKERTMNGPAFTVRSRAVKRRQSKTNHSQLLCCKLVLASTSKAVEPVAETVPERN